MQDNDPDYLESADTWKGKNDNVLKVYNVRKPPTGLIDTPDKNII